jgi:hypothetical protein
LLGRVLWQRIPNQVDRFGFAGVGIVAATGEGEETFSLERIETHICALRARSFFGAVDITATLMKDEVADLALIVFEKLDLCVHDFVKEFCF